MLVSAWAGDELRDAVARGLVPRPEFLELEKEHGVDILDWSRLGRGRRRSRALALRHAAAGFRRVRDYDVVFSDGEHVGIPLALALRPLSRPPTHVVIGHHLSARKKEFFFRRLKVHSRMNRILVHSRVQLEVAATRLGIGRERIQFVPYGADTRFWRPVDRPEEAVIVSAGREHRDYAVLARACAGLDHRLFIAAGSVYSPHADCTLPPADSEAVVRQVDHVTLRNWYAMARVVVVPLLPNDFQAGITTILEAMAMQKAVVVTATEGQRDVVVNGETGLLVAPGDVDGLRKALETLIAQPAERERLGRNARRAVEERFSLEAYVSVLAASLGIAAA